MKSLVILGSTGSIGRQTLEIVRFFNSELRVIGLAAGINMPLLIKQIQEFHPALVASGTLTGKAFLEKKASGLLENIKIVNMEEMAAHTEADTVVVATSGSVGLKPTLAAIGAGKNIILANKEVLVMAGEIITHRAHQRNVDIIPVDSEHSAIWQCLRGEGAGTSSAGEVSRLILTASGGPFRQLTKDQLALVTPEEALQHPTWQMGKKVTVDSATLFNKGMEIIEAHWLFGVPYSRIEVLIHPESIVHSMVEFHDGSIKAQLSYPDMRLPIQLALSYPFRWSNPALRFLNLKELKALTFEPPNMENFPCLRMAREAGEKGGTFPAVLSAADEVAVELFLAHKIGFGEIPGILEGVLQAHKGTTGSGIEAILAADAWAREWALKIVKEKEMVC